MRRRLFAWEAKALARLDAVRVLPPMVAAARGATLRDIGEEQEALERERLHLELQVRSRAICPSTPSKPLLARAGVPPRSWYDLP